MSAPESRRTTTVYLGLGSNLGDRAANLWTALAGVANLKGCQVSRLSPIYESDPVGPVEQGPFLNAVAVLRVGLSPHELLARTQEIEREMGRVPSIRWGPRLVDLDLLLFGHVRVLSDDLVLPHPELWNRRFALQPLLDVSNGERLRRRVEQQLERIGASQPVSRYEAGIGAARTTTASALVPGRAPGNET